jgi:hypothetical protein
MLAIITTTIVWVFILFIEVLFLLLFFLKIIFSWGFSVCYIYREIKSFSKAIILGFA